MKEFILILLFSYLSYNISTNTINDNISDNSSFIKLINNISSDICYSYYVDIKTSNNLKVYKINDFKKNKPSCSIIKYSGNNNSTLKNNGKEKLSFDIALKAYFTNDTKNFIKINIKNNKINSKFDVFLRNKR